MFCSRCGATIKPKRRLCAVCGQDLTAIGAVSFQASASSKNPKPGPYSTDAQEAAAQVTVVDQTGPAAQQPFESSPAGSAQSQSDTEPGAKPATAPGEQQDVEPLTQDATVLAEPQPSTDPADTLPTEQPATAPKKTQAALPQPKPADELIVASWLEEDQLTEQFSQSAKATQTTSKEAASTVAPAVKSSTEQQPVTAPVKQQDVEPLTQDATVLAEPQPSTDPADTLPTEQPATAPKKTQAALPQPKPADELIVASWLEEDQLTEQIAVAVERSAQHPAVKSISGQQTSDQQVAPTPTDTAEPKVAQLPTIADDSPGPEITEETRPDIADPATGQSPATEKATATLAEEDEATKTAPVEDATEPVLSEDSTDADQMAVAALPAATATSAAQLGAEALSAEDESGSADSADPAKEAGEDAEPEAAIAEVEEPATETEQAAAKTDADSEADAAEEETAEAVQAAETTKLADAETTKTEKAPVVGEEVASEDTAAAAQPEKEAAQTAPSEEATDQTPGETVVPVAQLPVDVSLIDQLIEECEELLGAPIVIPALATAQAAMADEPQAPAAVKEETAETGSAEETVEAEAADEAEAGAPTPSEDAISQQEEAQTSTAAAEATQEITAQTPPPAPTVAEVIPLPDSSKAMPAKVEPGDLFAMLDRLIEESERRSKGLPSEPAKPEEKKTAPAEPEASETAEPEAGKTSPEEAAKTSPVEAAKTETAEPEAPAKSSPIVSFVTDAKARIEQPDRLLQAAEVAMDTMLRDQRDFPETSEPYLVRQAHPLRLIHDLSKEQAALDSADSDAPPVVSLIVIAVLLVTLLILIIGIAAGGS